MKNLIIKKHVNEKEGEKCMDMFMIIWVVIDGLLLILFPFRNKFMEKQNRMPRRSIVKSKSVGMSLIDILLYIMQFLMISLFIYMGVYFIPDMLVERMLEWYMGAFLVAVFPVLLSYVKENSTNTMSRWKVCLIGLAVLFSIVAFLFEAEEIQVVSKYRALLNGLITLLIGTFFITLKEIRKGKLEYLSKRMPKKKIRNDLYKRTPELEINISRSSLIRCCEFYFDEYRGRYNKIKQLNSIEYVCLDGCYKEHWYKKITKFMKYFVVISLFCTILHICLKFSYKDIFTIVLIVIFGIVINIYKHVDDNYLKMLAFIYFYSEWGYYLRTVNGEKFVGSIQLIEATKYHKYIHSFLDLVAFFRAVALDDSINDKKNISIISSNLGELFDDYTNYNENRDWIMAVPLWACALFEYWVVGDVNENVKRILLKGVNQNVRADISIFLQSFWADMQKIESMESIDTVSDYIQKFEACIDF